MKSISELYNLIELELNKINYSDTNSKLYEPIKYILSLGGKRIRPILLLLSHQLFKEDLESSLRPAIGIELFHNFTLIHDDIMDKAPLRRGIDTVHKKWDDNTAILSGDTMMVKSYQLISEVKPIYVIKVFQIFNDMAIKVCEGQQLDMEFETKSDVHLNEYMQMIKYKTAVLFAASLKIGAVNAGATDNDADEIYQFGLNIGMAFQLKDDLLDAFGDSNTFGKQIGGDIIAGKKTFLYLKCLELLRPNDKKDFAKYYYSRDRFKVEEVKKVFLEQDIPSHTLDIISEYYEKSIVHLDAVDSKKKELLFEFAEKARTRIF